MLISYSLITLSLLRILATYSWIWYPSSFYRARAVNVSGIMSPVCERMEESTEHSPDNDKESSGPREPNPDWGTECSYWLGEIVPSGWVPPLLYLQSHCVIWSKADKIRIFCYPAHPPTFFRPSLIGTKNAEIWGKHAKSPSAAAFYGSSEVWNFRNDTSFSVWVNLNQFRRNSHSVLEELWWGHLNCELYLQCKQRVRQTVHTLALQRSFYVSSVRAEGKWATN